MRHLSYIDFLAKYRIFTEYKKVYDIKKYFDIKMFPNVKMSLNIVFSLYIKKYLNKNKESQTTVGVYCLKQLLNLTSVVQLQNCQNLGNKEKKIKMLCRIYCQTI